MDANAQSHKLIIFDARQNSVADTNKVSLYQTGISSSALLQGWSLSQVSGYGEPDVEKR